MGFSSLCKCNHFPKENSNSYSFSGVLHYDMSGREDNILIKIYPILKEFSFKTCK